MLLSGVGAMEGAAVCDLNGDGVPDVTLAPAGSPNYRYLLANTTGGVWNGTFTPSTGLAFLGTAGHGLASAELNHDGKPDVVTFEGPYLVALLSPASGNIAGGSPTRTIVGMSGLQPRLADLDRDGWMDVIVARGASGVSIVKGATTGGSGSYVFGAVTTIAIGGSSRDVALADFNHDGALDLAVASGDTDIRIVPGIVDALSRPTGAFGAPQSITVSTPTRTSWDVVAADLDEDGWEDLAVAVRAASGPSSIVVVMNQGDGTFGAPVSYDVNGSPKSLTATDVDKDGTLDIVAAATGAATVSLLQGAKTFDAQRYTLLPPQGMGVPQDGTMLAIGDLDNDGSTEVVVPSANTSILRGSCEPGVYTITSLVSGPGRVTRSLGSGRLASAGAFVRLSPAATMPEHHFEGWSGDTTGTMNPLQFVASRSRTYRALFTKNEYVLNVTIDGGGSVTRDPDLPKYTSGTVVTLTESPAEGYAFGNWSGDASGPNVTTTVTMVGGNKNVTAHFATSLFPLSVTVVGFGSVARDPDLLDYPANSTVTLTAIPGEGYEFASWSGALSGSASTQTLLMSAARSVTATFVNDLRFPRIRSVKDLPGDEGGRVKLEWFASSLDQPPAAPSHIGSYLVFRDVPTEAARKALRAGMARLVEGDASASSGMRALLHTMDAAGEFFWEYLATVPAAGFSGYSYVAPTTLDSTSAGPAWTRFKLQARTTDGTAWFNSAPDSGKSVDNLAPQPPAPITVIVEADANALHWSPNHEADLSRYVLHRGSTADFIPGPFTFVGEVSDTTYRDRTTASAWYKLIAVDVHGNPSAASAVFAGRTTDAPGGPPERFALSAFPNPSPGRTVLTLSLPSAGRVRVQVLDASGRRVARLADGMLAAGRWPLAWDGRDERGVAVPGGLYFALGETDAGRTVTRIALIR
jgi:hypothetical protein